MSWAPGLAGLTGARPPPEPIQARKPVAARTTSAAATSPIVKKRRTGPSPGPSGSCASPTTPFPSRLAFKPGELRRVQSGEVHHRHADVRAAVLELREHGLGEPLARV